MRKLLSAHFARLGKNRVFWISVIGIFVISTLFFLLYKRRYQVWYDESVRFMALDSYFFGLVLGFGLVDAIFAATYLGTEYADGTLRGKVIVGHSRRTIYMAGLVLCLTVNCCFVAVWLVSSLGVGIPLMGPLRMGIPRLLVLLLLLLLSTSAMMSIFTLCGMLSGNKAGTVVLCVLVFVGLLLTTAYLYGRLQEPEMLSNVFYSISMENGQQTTDLMRSDPQPNPSYLRGSARQVCEWLLDLLPTGPGLALTDSNVQRPLREMLCSLAVLVCSTGLGLWIFDRKNLK